MYLFLSINSAIEFWNIEWTIFNGETRSKSLLQRHEKQSSIDQFFFCCAWFIHTIPMGVWVCVFVVVYFIAIFFGFIFSLFLYFSFMMKKKMNSKWESETESSLYFLIESSCYCYFSLVHFFFFHFSLRVSVRPIHSFFIHLILFAAFMHFLSAFCRRSL